MKAKREEQIEAAHDLAIFGAPVLVPAVTTYKEAEAEAEDEAEIKDSSGCDLATSLLSEKVFLASCSFSLGRERESVCERICKLLLPWF